MRPVSSITVKEDISLITFPNSPDNPVFIADLFKTLAREKINVDMISQTAPQGGKIGLSFTFDDNDVSQVLVLSSELREKYSDLTPFITGSNSKILIYGEGMREQPGVSAAAFGALAEAGINIIMVTTSEIEISLLVSKPDTLKAVEVLKKAFDI